MTTRGVTRRHRWATTPLGVAALVFGLVLSGCVAEPGAGSESVSGEIVTDGSSTVAPLTRAARHQFVGMQPEVDIKVTTTGTTAGFRAFCAGTTDISNASREISAEERAACAEGGVEFTEIVVANDGISVIVNPANDWARDLTLEQLETMWAPQSQGSVTSWQQIDPTFPDEPLVLFGPGSDSGTLDFFTEAINGAEDEIRTDYSASEDDDNTVAGVRRNDGGVGFLGLSYVQASEGDVVAVSIEGVAPTTRTVQAGTYTPLSRPLFIYVSNASYADKPQVSAFVDFYVENAVEIAEQARVVPLTPEQVLIAQDELATLR